MVIAISPVFGQETRPRILLVFDTSGSMGIGVNSRLDTNGDNSAEHPGTGDTSRLSVAKRAIQGVVETTAEAEFALMRYPQLESAGLNTGEAGGFRYNNYAGLEERPLNYAGVCSGQLRGATAQTASSLLVPFAQNNDLAITRWLDHRENYPRNKELRATGPTPIVESLRLARDYFIEAMRSDADLRCRQNVVVLLTDGSESCVSSNDRADELRAATTALREIQIEQNGIDIPKDVRVFVLAFAVNQTAINQLSIVARAGGTAIRFGGLLDLVSGEPYQATDFLSLRDAFGRILTEAIPSERCNGQDDDCDGRVDEGVLNQCGACGDDPEELCNGIDEDCDNRIDEGVLNPCGLCGPVPIEICNDSDDDCDGRIDEDVINACGGCAAVSEELCNGVDDDCDGIIDNQPGTDSPLTRPCGIDIGVCSVGAAACSGGQFGECSGRQPSAETCNDLDDDCDGVTDEAQIPCGPALEIGNVGECRVGRYLCGRDECDADPGSCNQDGFRLECLDANGPRDEICDGRDNDCDGSIDEGLFNACGSCGPLPPEACNGRDDNCDGRVDEDARCPDGYLCVAAQCVLPCAGGECRAGLTCIVVFNGQRFCHPRPCDVFTCPSGTRCDPESGQCLNPCEGVVCEEDEKCQLGTCVPDACVDTACDEAQTCTDGLCQDQPCLDVDCEETQFCRDGDCFDACTRVTCMAGDVCRDGLCEADPCNGRCYRGTRCDPTDGVCVLDSCSGVNCPRGTACENGACSPNAPCAQITCPIGTECFDGTCTNRRVSNPPNLRPDASIMLDQGPDDMSATQDAGSGDLSWPQDQGIPLSEDPQSGCDCRSTHGKGHLVLGLSLILAALRKRRRFP
ncbi:MAG: MopE-related protein [Myxococcota bacterium]|nr:MopE-related protein [Myxococcota bacterium]